MLLSRRDVLTLLSGAAAGLPHELAAQPQPTAAGRLPIVGLLAIGRTDRQPSPPTRIVPSALAALGWIDGEIFGSQVTLTLSGLAGAVYAAQIEARHHRQIGTNYHEDGSR